MISLCISVFEFKKFEQLTAAVWRMLFMGKISYASIFSAVNRK